jgi:hypothetical protein
MLSTRGGTAVAQKLKDAVADFRGIDPWPAWPAPLL